MPNSFLH